MCAVQKNQWLPSARVEEAQFNKFKKILFYAYRHVTFYKNKFDRAGVKPENILTREDMLRIPLTTKREILGNFPHTMLADGYQLSKCHLEKTSGSSGLKLSIALDYKGKDFCDCVYGRALFSIGYKPWESMAYFWPAAYHRKEFHEHLGLMRKDWISSHIKAEEQLTILLALKPRILYCFPSILVAMAKIMEKEPTKYVSIRPRFIVSHAELLCEETRKYIEFVFKCPVYNEYGATEFGFRMAWECKKREGMHIDADSILIEFLNAEKPVSPGEQGEMVVSGLVNRAMPLIRYQIGDVGVFSNRKCSCGRGLPLFEVIDGRKDDFIVLPSGKVISPRVVVPLIEMVENVLEFRLVQKSMSLICIYAVTKGEVLDGEVEKLKKSLLEVFGEKISICFEIVNELSRNARGKLQAVVSEVKN